MSDKGHTALALACFWKHTESAGMLVRAGANLDMHMPNHVPTVIEWAAKQLQGARLERMREQTYIALSGDACGALEPGHSFTLPDAEA